MIPGSTDILQTDRSQDETARQNWQQILSQAVRSPRQLLQILGLDTAALPQLDQGDLDFPLLVPLPFVERMAPADPTDPLLLQVLPLAAEREAHAGYSDDPLQERQAGAVRGVIHKYQGRVLLVATGACAVHCRYCFRRHFPYQEHQASSAQWQESLDYIRADSSISEVILSGGDPLVLGNGRLQNLLQLLEAIPHLRRLRIHSRLPIVLPQRIDQGLLDLLRGSRLRCALVIHCNHPAELDSDVEHALSALRDTGISLLNQSVLLRGVNDNADTLATLSESLFDVGVLPYYLHLLDPVAGSAHFDVNQVTARHIYLDLLRRLPGYLVPKLVRENPLFPYKTPISVH